MSDTAETHEGADEIELGVNVHAGVFDWTNDEGRDRALVQVEEVRSAIIEALAGLEGQLREQFPELDLYLTADKDRVTPWAR